MQQILNSILELIKTNGLFAMFLGGFVEQIIVPIPSPIITMAGGAFLISLNLPIFETIFQIFSKVSLPYTIGATIGTSLVYFLAFFGGKPILDKFGKYIGISWKLIEKIKKDFQKTIKDELFILIACSIPIVPVSLVTAFCGGFKISPKKFYPMLFLALLIRATLLGFIGFQMGETFESLAHGLDKIESLLTIIGIFLILGFLYLKREKWIKNNS
ncbi:VTT domain-containing protein [Patescibacteria group bacterium]|nr:VTT domain-containing protein [Patescibacteria group bacterium]MCG2701662.1 VTT domain-containing protein [Candidatus Parcubacteria bacterium]MBU4265010.1 VTT domain-containing protein [Patescibacteria group bacterium]MBU4390163.1 VTT domain-containing protein [Patescibacteria group bacterium]MBU4397096.1 VTT domain-containing protein [Patescibacteria group bacterium]